MSGPERGFLRGMLGLCAVIVGSAPGWSMVPTLGLAFHTELGLGPVGLGLIAACVGVGYVVASLPAGGLIDRSGGQAVVVWGPVLLAASLAALVLLGSVPALVGVALLAGAIWAGCVSAVNRYSILLAPPARRGMAMGVIQSTTMAASGVAAFVLPPVAASAGWRASVVILVVGAAAAGGWAFLTFRGTHRVPAPPPGPRVRPRFPPRFKALLAFGVAIGVAMHCVWTFTLVYLVDAEGMSTGIASAALALLFVFAGAGRLLWGFVVDRGVSLWLLLTLSALGGAAGMLAFTVRAGVGWLFGCVVVVGVLMLGHNTMYLLAGMRMIPPSGWAVAGAALTSAHVVGSVVGPPLFGLVVDHGGGYGVAWSLAAGVLAASTMALRLAARP